MLKIKFYLPRGLKQKHLYFFSFFNVRGVMYNNINQPKTKTRNRTNYELTMMTLKGETFAGFKIQDSRCSIL